jgi:hypothetical protein
MEELLTARCACGWETTGTRAEVVEATIDHGRRLHNMEATPEQVLASAIPAVPEAGVTSPGDTP